MLFSPTHGNIQFRCQKIIVKNILYHNIYIYAINQHFANIHIKIIIILATINNFSIYESI